MDLSPISFIDEPIEPYFRIPPALEKKPGCPDGFRWRNEDFSVVELLGEWVNFQRRDRMARNMEPAHAQRAKLRGSWGVGRFFFRVRVENNRIFELYYDRTPGDVDDRKGRWVLKAEFQFTSEG